jgi:NAD(P)-dependent dehydrogenase (short-subunit alcohol dehydrogenase family)
MDIKDVAALVTGGGSGLGEATAAALAAGGARVTVIDRNREAAETVAARIGGFAVVFDVADEQGAAAGLAVARARNGPARILVNCAGIATGSRIVGKDGPMPLDAFERVIRVNLIGTFNMLRLAATEMSTLPPLEDEERGVIMMTASVAAFEGQIGQAAYSASKGGVAAMTMPASRELARFGIRVFTIAPGLFLTPLLASLPEETKTGLAAAIPFPRRLGAPEDFADLALAGIRNRYLNGEVIRLDGALRMAPR